MTEKDLAQLLIDRLTYLLSNSLFETIGIFFSVATTLVGVTWFVAHRWHKREINFLKEKIIEQRERFEELQKGQEKILREEITYLERKLKDNDNYIQGMIGMFNREKAIRENDLQQKSNLYKFGTSEGKTVDEITKFYNKFCYQSQPTTSKVMAIDLKVDKISCEYSSFNDFKISHLLSLFSKYFINTDAEDPIISLYHFWFDMSKKHDIEFYKFYSNTLMYSTMYLIVELEATKRELRKSNFQFIQSQIDTIKYNIEIMKPLLVEKESVIKKIKHQELSDKKEESKIGKSQVEE